MKQPFTFYSDAAASHVHTMYNSIYEKNVCCDVVKFIKSLLKSC